MLYKKKGLFLIEKKMYYRYIFVIFLVVLAVLTGHYEILILSLVLLLWYSKPKYICETQPHKIRILTYNMFMRPNVWFVKHSVSDYKNQRLEHFIEDHVQRFDVMVLQELFSLFTLRQHQLLNESYEYSAVTSFATYGCFNRNGTFNIPLLDAGVVTVSKFPISASDTHTYTKGNQIDGWMPKQVLWTLLKLPEDRFLNLFNTHMQATHSHRPNKPASDVVRHRQIEELATFAREKMSTYKYPALICGDFNLDSRGLPLDYTQMMEILKGDLKDAELGYEVVDLQPEHPITFGCPGETTLTHSSDVGSEMCIDYMLYVGPPNLYRIKSQVEEFRYKGNNPFTQLSDHYGISCVLEWGED